MDVPEPLFTSWADFRARTAAAELHAWCARKAKTANRPKLLSGTPELRITSEDVWLVLAAARGRCVHCGSLAVERRPSGADGRPLPWEMVGRRIGSLDHREPFILGGVNEIANLGWSCLWCNTWPTERSAGAMDHGGQQVDEPAGGGGDDRIPPWAVELGPVVLARFGRLAAIAKR